MVRLDYDLRSFWYALGDPKAEYDPFCTTFVEAAPLVPLGSLEQALAALESCQSSVSSPTILRPLTFFCVKQLSHWQVCLDSRITSQTLAMWTEWTDTWCASSSMLVSLSSLVEESHRTTRNGWQVFYVARSHEQQVLDLVPLHHVLGFALVLPISICLNLYWEDCRASGCFLDTSRGQEASLDAGEDLFACSEESTVQMNNVANISPTTSIPNFSADSATTTCKIHTIHLTLTQRETTYLIGRAGSRLNKIRSQYDCIIKVYSDRPVVNVPRRSAAQQVILTGTLASTKAASDAISLALAAYGG